MYLSRMAVRVHADLDEGPPPPPPPPPYSFFFPCYLRDDDVVFCGECVFCLVSFTRGLTHLIRFFLLILACIPLPPPYPPFSFLSPRPFFRPALSPILVGVDSVRDRMLPYLISLSPFRLFFPSVDVFEYSRAHYCLFPGLRTEGAFGAVFFWIPPAPTFPFSSSPFSPPVDFCFAFSTLSVKHFACLQTFSSRRKYWMSLTGSSRDDLS